ncbi:MAG TPA: ABC transporter permease [Bryobacteraceae bacterium]|nr:ABC transporter permease [Bryobacteraceae bacterium]
MKRWWRRLRSRSVEEPGVQDEIAFHLEQRAQLNRQAGLSEDQALASARRQFGNVTRISEDVRRMHVNTFFESLLQDLRYAARGLARSPIFALTAIFAAALGIGSTTAVFSVVDRILFRSLPYANEDRLVSVGMLAPLDTNEFFFAENYFDLRRHQTPFESVTSFTALTTGQAGCDLSEVNPIRLACAQVEASFLPTLGITPLLGRNFTVEEDRRNAARVALMSYGLWQSRFARDPATVGRVFSVDGAPVTIVGILPADFELPTMAVPDLVFPEALNEATEHAGRALRVFARLKPGVSIVQARAALQPLFEHALETAPPRFRKEISFRIRSLRDRQVQDARVAAWVLLASVVAVLLIACANIANLLLARSINRRKEIAVRAALGAGRARLIRQTLTESVLLSACGGALGCALAWALLRVFIALAPNGIPHLEQASIDTRVLFFVLAVSLLSALIFGLAPAFQRSGSESLIGARSTSSHRMLLREALVALEIAVSLVLLTGAGMLLRSLVKLQSSSLGLNTDHVVTAEFVLGRQRYSQPVRQFQFYEELERRMRDIPGISTLAISDSVPPFGATRSLPFASLRVEGQPPFTEGTGGMVTWRYVTPGYFQALGIPILAGRAFSENDRGPGDERIVLGESLARKLFPGGDAVGKRFQYLTSNMVLGVACDVKDAGPAEPPPLEFYVVRKYSEQGIFEHPGGPDGWRSGRVILRTPLDPRVISGWITREFAALDPQLPVNISTLEQRFSKLAQRPRFNAMLLATFAGMGVLLAAIGLYGVMAFLVGQRTPEIGIRMALGATPAAVARWILSRAALWTLAGALAGLAGSLFATSALRTLLFQVPQHDPWTLALAFPALLLIALAAAWIPSRKAARTDPSVALRHE